MLCTPQCARHQRRVAGSYSRTAIRANRSSFDARIWARFLRSADGAGRLHHAASSGSSWFDRRLRREYRSSLVRPDAVTVARPDSSAGCRCRQRAGSAARWPVRTVSIGASPEAYGRGAAVASRHRVLEVEGVLRCAPPTSPAPVHCTATTKPTRTPGSGDKVPQVWRAGGRAGRNSDTVSRRHAGSRGRRGLQGSRPRCSAGGALRAACSAEGVEGPGDRDHGTERSRNHDHGRPMISRRRRGFGSGC